VAISVAWQTTYTNITSSAALYTTPASGTAAFGGYARDLVITNGASAAAATNVLFISASTTATAANTTGSLCIPPGGSAILTQCAVPFSTIIYGFSPGTASASIGFATNVNYF
jgi:hypothetical protein